jgi:two-component sensor histidine kinase/CheY-like chemotaxis protein
MTPMQSRVLYIDDDEALAYLVRRHLTREGFAVETVVDGDAGLARLREGKFDVVALDHYMPGRMGMDVLALIRELSDAPPVIYVTAADEGRVAVAALKSGAVDYVIKNVDNEFMPLLTAALRNAIKARENERAKRAADEEMRRAREKAELLLREMNHRIANSLSLVASLVNMQVSQADDETLSTALKDTHNRIIAIAQLHRSLYTTDNVGTVEMKPYLGSLLEEIEISQTAMGEKQAIKGEIDNIELSTEKAISLGVIVSELVTNALKYAYPGNAGGEVRVRLQTTDEGWRLSVEDDGVGWKSGTPTGSGLGMKIVRAMAVTLDGELNIEGGDGGGSRITVTSKPR